MQAVLRLAVILGMVLAGPAHLVCACGCGDLGQSEQRQEAACPRCCHEPSDSEPGDSRPCECRTCKPLQAVVPAGQAPAGPTLVVFDSGNASPPVATLPALTSTPKAGPFSGPAHSRALPVCALPLLLGHLLF
jgi:hypothetical protein